MDTRNVIAAISLSACVIVLWGLFFVESPDPNKIKKDPIEKTKVVENSEAPSLDQNEEIKKISRDDAIKKSSRIFFENENVFGSINLMGCGIIDDFTFKKYNQKLNSKEKVVLLNPENAKDPYLINTSWATNSLNIKTPDNKTICKIQNNSKLTPGNPVTIYWENDQLRFEKTISIDNKYLFKIKQKVINFSTNSYLFHPYGQILRENLPADLTKFFILHNGFMAYAEDDLVEEDYDDIKKDKYSRVVNKGFISMQDSYWMAALAPEKGREFRIDFDYKNKKYRASFIDTKGIELKGNSSIENNTKIIIGAKTVKDINFYQKSEDIEKLDLSVSWGVFYIIEKPMWYALEYFYKLTGNWGYAIILLTIVIRIVFFPLNQMSFKSMSRMKKLSPQINQIKAKYAHDKMEMQKATQKLFKANNVNPLSGCLPILVTIPFFFGMYKIIMLMVDFRHQEFLWIWTDLAAKDPANLFTLFGLFEWKHPDFLDIGIMPLIFGVTMYISQKFSASQMQDPIQRKIFAWFPVFITVILAPFATGLILYWVTNNILQILQQWLVQNQIFSKEK